jgi:hypothetical protein
MAAGQLLTNVGGRLLCDATTGQLLCLRYTWAPSITVTPGGKIHLKTYDAGGIVIWKYDDDNYLIYDGTYGWIINGGNCDQPFSHVIINGDYYQWAYCVATKDSVSYATSLTP